MSQMTNKIVVVGLLNSIPKGQQQQNQKAYNNKKCIPRTARASSRLKILCTNNTIQGHSLENKIFENCKNWTYFEMKTKVCIRVNTKF